MRLLLVAALVAVAFAARDSEKWSTDVRAESVDKHEAFKKGYEYRYNLESQVSNGLAVPGSQQAAMRAKSLVTLSFPETETIAHMRIEKIRFAALQKEMEQPKDLKPFELFDELELNEDQLRQLRLPLRFRYENGLVSEIEFDREDAEWSKNIKRVYLNMLQVDLSRKNVVSEPHRLYTENDAAYSVPEMTLEGDCEVLYTVLPSTKTEKKDMLVTKSISFANCTRRVGQKTLAMPLEQELTEKREERREVESSTLFNYRIRGTAERFLIKEVELRSVYSYAPLGQENTLFTTVVSGNLRLLDIAKETERIPAPKCDKKESLLHSMEWEKKEAAFLATGDETLLRDSPYPEMKNKPEIVIRMVKSLVAHMESEEKGIELAATHEMGRIVRVLRLATKEDIKRMHNELCSSGKDSQLKEVFTDALAIAGSFNCVQHLVEKIRARELSSVRSAKVLKQLSSLPVPSEQIVRSLITLCKDSKREPLECQTCWLSVGALMNGVCGADVVTIENEKACPRDVKERFVAELTEQYEQAESRYEKVLALKSLGNSGIELIVFPLEKVVRDVREERIVRVHAIEALRKLRTAMPRKITAILMPLYKDGLEHPEIRVAAFKHIIKCLPDQAIVHQIVDHLNRERSTQVHAYVSDALLSMSRSSVPEHQRLASTLQHALKFLRPRATPRKTVSSNYKFFTTVNEETGNEATLNWATLFTNDSALPNEIFTSGRWNKHVGHLGLNQHNMDQQLYKLLEFVESSPSLDVILRGKRSDSGASEVLRGLFPKLSIARREKYEKNAHAFVYFRSNDMDNVFLPLDEKIVAHLLKNVDVHFDKIGSLLAKGLRFNTLLSTVLNENKHTLVHSMGMPLVYSTKMPVIFKVDGEVKAELEDVRRGEAAVLLRARPTIAATHVTKVEILSPLVNLGVKILHSATLNVPVDVKTELNWKNQLVVKTTYGLPQESQRLVQLQTRPVSFVRVWPKDTRVYVQAKEKTIYVDQLETLVHRIEDSYLEKATGMKLAVEGHYHGHIFDKEEDNMPQALLIGENNLEVRFEKTPETPKEYVFKTEIGLFTENGNMERPKMERFLEKEEHFETEDFEDFEESEKSRRGEYEKYVKEYETEESYSHRLYAEVMSVGGRKEHKAEVELKTECDARMRHCRVKINGMRTPMLEKEARDWTIKSEVEMLYPEMPKSLKQLAGQKHRELSVNVEARWGCEEKNEIRMKIQGEQNQEQKKWMKIVAEQRDEELTPMEEYYRLIQASMLNQYKAVVDYDIQTPASHRLINGLFTQIKANAPFFSTTLENGHNQKNMMRARLTIEPATRQHATLSIHTPTEKVTINDISMPVVLPLVNIRRQQTAPVRSLSHLGSALVDDVKAVCTVDSNRIRTFDDVIYRTPLTTCYSVLAKDCSSEQFAVLVKKISKSGEEKKVKIVSKKSIIELEMDKQNKREKMVITIDGEETIEEDRLRKAGIYNKEDIVVVDLDDVSVEFDGYAVNVKMSEYYKNKQCGICGHFDGEKKNEFRRADNEETEDLEEFHRSYLVKGKECKVEEEKLSEKRNYRIESEESEEEEYDISRFESKQQKKSKKTGNDYEETVEPEQKTRVVEYSNRVCFSKKAVPDCPEQTVTDQDNLKEIKVAFVCLSRSDAQTARFLREARRDVLDLEDFPVDFSETKHVPRACIAY